jgi:methionyl aminopeptidase
MFIKSAPELALIKKGGVLMGKILKELQAFTKAGMSLAEVDAEAERLIIECGGKPAFKGYTTRPSDPPFPSTICASVNEELVHGIARPNVILKDGDIFSIDIGMEWPVRTSASGLQTSDLTKTLPNSNSRSPKTSRGYFTDTATTFPIGKIEPEIEKLLHVTRQALEVGIKAAQPGRTVASIGKAIEAYVRSEGGYGIVRDLVGHGVGHEVHEDPQIPNFYDPTLERFVLKPGMVIALEPMISLSGEINVKMKRDGWTIVMADGSPCAHFEHTLIITRTGNTVVTRRPDEKKERY